MKKAIIHIGDQKNGSKSFQQFLVCNRDALERTGYFLPAATKLDPNGYDLGLMAFCGVKRFVDQVAAAKELGSNDHAHVRDHIASTLAREVEDRRRAVDAAIFSFEGLLHAPGPGIADLRALLASLFDDIEVICSLRRQDRRLCSGFSTKLEHGHSDVGSNPFRDENDALHTRDSLFKRLDYRRKLGNWHEQFGVNAVRVLNYEHYRADIVEALLAFDENLLRIHRENPALVRKNRSMSATGQSYVLTFNRELLQDPLFSKLSARQLHRLRATVGRRFEGERFLPPRAEAEYLNGLFEESNAGLAIDLGFADGDTFFDGDFSEYPVDPEPLTPRSVPETRELFAQVAEALGFGRRRGVASAHVRRPMKLITGFHEREEDELGGFRWLESTWSFSIDSPTATVMVRYPLKRGVMELLDDRGELVDHHVLRHGAQPIRLSCAPGRAMTVRVSPVAKVPGDSRDLALRLYEASDDGATEQLPEPQASWLSGGWLRIGVEAGDRNRVHGHLIDAADALAPGRLAIDGSPVEGSEHGLTNPDHRWAGPVFLSAEVETLHPEAPKRIHTLNGLGEATTPGHQDWYLLPDPPGPLPSAEHMERVAGTGDAAWFHLAGGTFVHKAQLLAEKLQGKGFERASMLDWGCGCGRLTRHLGRYGPARVTGVDIDPVNVSWCRANLRDVDVHLVSPREPLPFENDTFDHVLGHSVFTHLDEESQHFWLAELRRVVKPGGLLFLTVMSSLSVINNRLEGAELEQLLEGGFLDVGHQDDGVDSVEPGYYRTIYHRPAYVREQWSAYFDVLSMLDGFADHQCLVLCQRR